MTVECEKSRNFQKDRNQETDGGVLKPEVQKRRHRRSGSKGDKTNANVIDKGAKGLACSMSPKWHRKLPFRK